MFSGTYEHTVDRKGRMSVPSRFRDFIATKSDGRMMITNYVFGEQHCLEVYPYDEWHQFLENVGKLNRFDSRRQALENFYIAGARDCWFDPQGRILIPPKLREYANLKRDVVVTGATERFRIWAQEIWDKMFQDAEAMIKQDPNVFGDLKV